MLTNLGEVLQRENGDSCCCGGTSGPPPLSIGDNLDHGTSTYTTSGSHVNLFNTARVFAVKCRLNGGGAGEGTYYAVGPLIFAGGGAGGGGAFSEKTIATASTFNSFVGAPAGATGIAPSSGHDGQDSWAGSSSTVKAAGGKGGGYASNSTTAGAGGLGGAAADCIGDIVHSGGRGGNGGVSGSGLTYTYGGGGAGAGPSADGGDGGDSNGVTSGDAGIAPTGGGNGAFSGDSRSPTAAQAPGGGTGGGGGGAAKAGQAILIW